ncbi:MAG: FmdB family zinc ribbon protein [Nitrospiria bacterium]
MPIYEYECKSCWKRFEVLQKISDPPLDSCSACQGEVRKLVSPSGLIFKGSGFYITDYARKDNNGPSDAKGKSKPAASAGEKSKKETPSKPKPKSKD